MAIVTERKNTGFYSSIGRIAKGGERKTVFSKKHNKEVETAGENLDYFRFVPKSTTPDHEARLLEVWHKSYGGEPDALNIFFKTSDIDLILNDWFREFASSGLKVQCDGERIHYLKSRTEQDMSGTKPCKSPGKETGCGDCVRSILFRFCIFELESLTGKGDVELSTKSVYDRSYLQGQLIEISEKLAIAGQKLAYVPLILSRVKRVVTKTTPDRQYKGEESLLDIKIEPRFQANLIECIRGQVFQSIGASYDTLAIAGAAATNTIAPASPQLALPSTVEAEVIEPWVNYWTKFTGACDRCVTTEKLILLTDWAKTQKAYLNNPESHRLVDDKLGELALELSEDEI